MHSDDHTEDEGRTTSSTSHHPSSMTPADFLRSVISSGGLHSAKRIRRGCTFEQYQRLLAKVTGEKKKLKLKLLEGDLIITEFPLIPHEIVTRSICASIARLNTLRADPLMDTGSTTYRTVGHQHGIAPDAGFINRRLPTNLVVEDANHNQVPIIVIETALSEDWETIMKSVRTYFDLGVIQVVYFKLFKTVDMQRPSRIRLTQMYMMDFRRPNNYVAGMAIRASHVISFGHQLPHRATEQAILHRTGVIPADFVGYGRHNVNQPNQLCQNAGNQMYRLTFPAQVIWHSVPQDAIPAGAFVDYNIDLFSIIDDLIPRHLPAIAPPPAVW
jgi:Uma2 family endonuclease